MTSGAPSGGQQFTGHVVQAPTGGALNHAIGVVRGPGGSVAIIQVADPALARATQTALDAANKAAAALNAGQYAAEWDAAIRAKEEAEVASAGARDARDLQALAGIPTNNALGNYLQVRSALRVALGLAP